MNEELLYNQLYERTKDFGRTQFIKELMRLERESQQLKEQLKLEIKVREEINKYNGRYNHPITLFQIQEILYKANIKESE